MNSERGAREVRTSPAPPRFNETINPHLERTATHVPGQLERHHVHVPHRNTDRPTFQPGAPGTTPNARSAAESADTAPETGGHPPENPGTEGGETRERQSGGVHPEKLERRQLRVPAAAGTWGAAHSSRARAGTSG